MTIEKKEILNRTQLTQITNLAATLKEAADEIGKLYKRKHPALTDAEFMISAAHQKIHTTLKQLGIEF